jgi:hypothetical protein
MSRDTLFELLRRGEILPEGRTKEEEARWVGAEKPTVQKRQLEIGSVPHGIYNWITSPNEDARVPSRADWHTAASPANTLERGRPRPQVRIV